MANWRWTTAKETDLAHFVTPQRAVLALGGRPPISGGTDYDLRQGDHFEDMIQAIYEDLSERRIEYDLEPVNSDTKVQEIRPPESISGSETLPGKGTCIDLALLFAGLCLERRLRPLVVVFKTHAIALVSKVDAAEDASPAGAGSFAGGVCRNIDDLVHLVETLQSHIAIECTGFSVAHSKPNRDERGLLDFDAAKLRGTDALDRTDLKMAIDPLALHRAGIEPHENDPLTDDRIREFLAGVNSAGAAIGAVGHAIQSNVGDTTDLDSMEEALNEVLKTYDIVLESTRDWLELAVGGDPRDNVALLTDLSTGNLVEVIEERRGHCHRIRDLYDSGGRDFLVANITDADNLQRTEDAFSQLAGADYTFFDQAARAGQFLVDTATSVIQYVANNDDAAAAQEMATAVTQVAILQQGVGKNRRELLEVMRQLGIEPPQGDLNPARPANHPNQPPPGPRVVQNVERGVAIVHNEGPINLSFDD